MEFEENHISDFLNIFASSKDQIRSFPGCIHLQLLQDESDPCVFFTYSHWRGEDDLKTYRYSDLFKSVWGDTRKLFRTAPRAWSLSDRTAVVSGTS
jgi:heme-degrading monooxygenase HmoA